MVLALPTHETHDRDLVGFRIADDFHLPMTSPPGHRRLF